MNKDAIIARLKANEAALRARGVSHAALFGSHARGDNRPDSDIDVLVEMDTERRISLFTYAGLCEELQDLFDTKVDVANMRTLKPRLRDSILSEAVYAF